MTINTEADILARTIYGEARGESVAGQEAIASVVLNRVAFSKRKGRYWWGNTVAEVCRAPRQFSCWNRDDPNFQKINAVGAEDASFRICRRIAARALSGVWEDRTSGATHYHALGCRPAWARGKIPCAEIGSHFFYNDIEK